MARKGENIYKRKDGRYEGRYIKAYDKTMTKDNNECIYYIRKMASTVAPTSYT